MPRKSRTEKAETHEAILKTAAGRFRKLGLQGIGVADLMKESGRTSGGFYRHFESRDQLVEETLKFIFSARAQKLSAGFKNSLTAHLNDHLSTQHRDSPSNGCGVSALVNDVSRAGEHAKRIYGDQVEVELDALFDLMPNGLSSTARRSRSVLALCTMVGALSLARAVSNEDLSNEILSTRKLLLQVLKEVPTDA